MFRGGVPMWSPDEEAEYEVERLLDKRTRYVGNRPVIQYLVRWKGDCLSFMLASIFFKKRSSHCVFNSSKAMMKKTTRGSR